MAEDVVPTDIQYPTKKASQKCDSGMPILQFLIPLLVYARVSNGCPACALLAH